MQLTQDYTQEEFEAMLHNSKLMAIHLTNNKIWIGLIYETIDVSIIFNPLQLEYNLGEDKKYHITFEYISVATKDEIIILKNNNILFCANVHSPIKEQYTKYYRIDFLNTDSEDEIDDNVIDINKNKKLH